MLSPTNATIDSSFSTLMGSILPNSISFSNDKSIVSFALKASAVFTPKQIECSDDA